LSLPGQGAMLCRVRPPIAVLAVVVVTACGCSGGSAADQPELVQKHSTAPVPHLSQRNAPLKVSVKKVTGSLSKAARLRLKMAAGMPIREWLDAGFVEGAYPRADFSSAYRVFTTAAARSAQRDRGLLTNIQLGPHVVDVVAKQRSAQLSVLAVHGHPRGVSARVHLRLLAFHRDGSRVTARVTGDLYLTRAPNGHWKIFGYDLSREAGSR
jgi:hypothetical protein